MSTQISTDNAEDQSYNATEINKIITIVYVSIQVIIALFVSTIGAYHVRTCLNESKSNTNVQTDRSIQSTKETKDKLIEQEHESKDMEHDEEKQNINININDDTTENKKEKGFCELWLKTVWKMRGIYGGLAVHAFDVLTDVLVIIEWLNMENIKGDNIDPQVMAYCAIAAVAFSKIISSIAIFLKEENTIRSLLQLFDLLIFVEIYEAHRKVISQIRNRNIEDKSKAIESTLSFKYIRQCEAVFESIPESVLQLVFIMRTGFKNVKGSLLPLFIISIIQSIVSMVNSITNNDYTRMQDDKFRKYKQRLPPSWDCFKHFLSRLSEVVYRIGLLALFWTVCGGLAFGMLIVYELFVIAVKLWLLRDESSLTINQETILLNLNSVIVLPSEEFYAYGGIPWTSAFNFQGCKDLTMCFCINLCVCVSPAACIIGLPLSIARCNKGVEIHFIPLFRISTSFCEFIFLFFWGIFGVNGTRFSFLFYWNHGLSMFIISSVFYVIFTQYLILFPNFDLPFSANIRSKWGYSYSNEISEIDKIKIPKKIPYRTRTKTQMEMGDDDQLIYDIPMEIRNGKLITPAIIALVSGHQDMVKFMEDKGALSHKNIDAKSIEIPNKKEINEYIQNPLTDDENTKYTKNNQIYTESLVVLEGNVDNLGLEHDDVYLKNLGTMPLRVVYDITNEADFWDEPFKYVNGVPVTAAMFAMVKGNDDILHWLEKRGTTFHKSVNPVEIFSLFEKEEENEET